MGIKTPTGNWTRTPRLTAEEIHGRAVARREHRNMLKKVFNVGDEAFYAPHRNRPTPERKLRLRSTRGSGPVARLSMAVK